MQKKMHEFGSGAKNVHRNASKAGNFLCSEGIAECEEHLVVLIAHAGGGNSSSDVGLEGIEVAIGGAVLIGQVEIHAAYLAA